MARQSKQNVEVNFVKGLITETTALRFPKDASTETFNCIFSETGRLTRRKGLDAEASFVEHDQATEVGAAFMEYSWKAVGGSGEISFLVIQRGSIIEFYDISTSVVTVSGSKKTFSIDLNLYVPTDSTADPALSPCKFADGNGNLIIVSPAIEPLLVVYSEDLDSISVEVIPIRSRDFVGVEDGLGVTERPTSTVASLKTDNPEHYYNLLNQGWHYAAGVSLGAWDTARADLPSNADAIGFYLSSTTGALDTTLTTNKTPGNTEAPKGHFILNPFAPSRTQAMIDDGFTGATISTTSTLVNLVGGTPMSTNISYSAIPTTLNVASNIANGFDSNTGTLVTHPNSTRSFLGINLPTPTKIISARVRNFSSPGTTTLLLYGKVGAYPTDLNQCTYLGSYTNVGAVSAVDATIASSDITTEWDYVFYHVFNTHGSNITAGELEFYTYDTAENEQPITLTRPSSTAFFAGRAWYAGVNGLDLNNTVFFSQIVQRNNQYGRCYQQNDPTSQDFPDLLQDDGGFIKIPGAATIVHIGAFHNSLLVFATNGVWAISGSNKQYFTATAYGVRKISGVGTSASVSFADVKGVPFWWGESGIYTVDYDPNYDAYEVKSLTDESIYTFFSEIPANNRRFVKASYDIDSETVTWLYNDTASLSSADYYKYTKSIVFNTLSKAFYPWTFSVASGYPDIRGIVHTRAALDASSSLTKLIVTTEAGSIDSLTFAETRDNAYVDWASFGTGIDYDSYAITGYSYDGALMRKSAPLYVMVYMEEEDQASCFLRGIFDWTTSTSEGKTSNAQQIYSTATNRTVKARRLKIRGNGRALQLKFFSESGKPFTIVGWGIVTTTDGGL